jgi:hypothetical protein
VSLRVRQASTKGKHIRALLPLRMSSGVNFLFSEINQKSLDEILKQKLQNLKDDGPNIGDKILREGLAEYRKVTNLILQRVLTCVRSAM